MELEKLLTTTPVEQWAAQDVLALEWYDGPREGVCSLTRPGGEFYFKLLDERYNPDGLDDRLFRLSELPPGSVGALRSVWQFSNEAERQRAEQSIQLTLAVRRPTALVIWTQDFEHFLGCWTVERTEPDRKDWFAALGVPAPAAAPEE